MHFQTKRDLSILHQHTKNMYVMAQILNYDMQIVDSFQGSITEYSIAKTATLIQEEQSLFLL